MTNGDRPGPDDESRSATIVVDRLDGGPRLVIERADALARDFFTKDASSIGVNAYDRMAGQGGDPDRITTKDVLAINTTMRARSPHSAWEALTGAPEPLPWLAAMPSTASLFMTTDEQWPSLRPLIEEALTASVGPYRNLSVATKVLHLKRPHLFPVLDSLVVQQIGAVGRQPIELVEHLRRVGRRNERPLTTVSDALEKVNISRSLVRILDALLWASHPAAGLASQLGTWEHRIKPTD